jgi:hypothetical protein
MRLQSALQSIFKRSKSPPRHSAACKRSVHYSQIPIAGTAAPAQSPAGSFSGGFRTTAPVPVHRAHNGAVVRNPSQKLTHAPQAQLFMLLCADLYDPSIV